MCGNSINQFVMSMKTLGSSTYYLFQSYQRVEAYKGTRRTHNKKYSPKVGPVEYWNRTEDVIYTFFA